MEPRVGLVFVHARRLDPSWRPAPGQRYVDGPHEVYRVTKITASRVYYAALGGSGKAMDYSSRESFCEIVLRVVEA